MTKVDRYDFRSKHHGTEVVVKSREGKWVKASDYDALTAERDKWMEAHGQACANWRDQCQHEMDKTKAAEASSARLRAELTKAADSLDWADAHLEDAGVVSANVRYGARDARAALTGKADT
jgi:hypothetical protein